MKLRIQIFRTCSEGRSLPPIPLHPLGIFMAPAKIYPLSRGQHRIMEVALTTTTAPSPAQLSAPSFSIPCRPLPCCVLGRTLPVFSGISTCVRLSGRRRPHSCPWKPTLSHFGRHPVIMNKVSYFMSHILRSAMTIHQNLNRLWDIFFWKILTTSIIS